MDRPRKRPSDHERLTILIDALSTGQADLKPQALMWHSGNEGVDVDRVRTSNWCLDRPIVELRFIFLKVLSLFATSI
jgi:hypothetical protein